MMGVGSKESSTNFNAGKEIVMVEGIFKRETEKAVLIGFAFLGDIWLPLSQMPSFPEIGDVSTSECTALIPRWLAEKNKIPYEEYEMDADELDEKDWDDRDSYTQMYSRDESLKS